jgi:hypothetical protein
MPSGLRSVALTPLVASTLLVAVAAAAAPARAERWVSAYDPRLHVKPPTMKGIDGRGGMLMVDADLQARARALRASGARLSRAAGAVVQQGEVVIIEGSDETLEMVPGGGYAVRMTAVARKVIERFGDNFQAMTFWLTFDETSSRQAQAYEFTVKADVRGLGITVRDNSGSFGSQGVLRSILNMKRVWQYVSRDLPEAWRPHLETWGQESGHRWMVFMDFRDRRTGNDSDAIRGRDCSHYNRFVDTQGSVHDGFAWTDQGNGTFKLGARNGFRFGNLDMYGMGLVPADELPPFFLIDGLANYRHVPCGQYDVTPGRPNGAVVTGTRVDIGIDDIVAANGPRLPAADDLLAGKPQDYFREAQVVITSPDETATSPMPVLAAERVEKGRQYWEEWMRAATDNRMVVCTRLSADCGDARSDVTDVRFNAAGKAPAAGPLTLEMVVSNGGQREATNVEARVDVSIGDQSRPLTSRVGALAPGDSRTVAFELDLGEVACGTEMTVKAATQSDFHRNRKLGSVLVGTSSPVRDGFEDESGWVVNPEANDSTRGARWERGTPRWSEVQAGTPSQPEGARAGANAWVTGASAAGGASSYVHDGRTTLESPALDASGWREPRLRYWVSFAAVQERAGGGVMPSANARLVVLGRLVAGAGGDAGAPAAGDGGAGGGDWIEVDRLENAISPTWKLRTVALPAALTGGPVKLRFVAEDGNMLVRGGVEAAIDDVEITSNLPACYDPPPPPKQGGGGGGGCAAAGAGGGRVGVGADVGVGLIYGVSLVLLAMRPGRGRRRRRP